MIVPFTLELPTRTANRTKKHQAAHLPASATKEAAGCIFQVLLTMTPVMLSLLFPTHQPMKEVKEDKACRTLQIIHLGK